MSWMCTRLCAVALTVHAREREENTAFASVAVISQHKDRRSVDASKRAHLVADEINKSFREIKTCCGSVQETALVCDWNRTGSVMDWWDRSPVKTKKIMLCKMNLPKASCCSNYGKLGFFCPRRWERKRRNQAFAVAGWFLKCVLTSFGKMRDGHFMTGPRVLFVLESLHQRRFNNIVCNLFDRLIWKCNLHKVSHIAQMQISAHSRHDSQAIIEKYGKTISARPGLLRCFLLNSNEVDLKLWLLIFTKNLRLVEHGR